MSDFFPTLFYVLDAEGCPVPCRDIPTWDDMMEQRRNVVAQTTIADVRVSTVFIGLDYNLTGNDDDDPRPILWETLVSGGEYDQDIVRYRTLADARAGHDAYVALVEAAIRARQDRP